MSEATDTAAKKPIAAPAAPEPFNTIMTLFLRGRDPIRFLVSHRTAVLVMQCKLASNPASVLGAVAQPTLVAPEVICFEHDSGTSVLELSQLEMVNCMKVAKPVEAELNIPVSSSTGKPMVN